MINSLLDKKIKKAVATNFEAQTKFLRRLVRTKSVNESTPGCSDSKSQVEEAVAEAIYNKLKALKLAPKKIGAAKGRPNVVCYWGPTRFRKSLIFNGHMDTTPPAVDYKLDPFSGVVRGNKLYGLGALDMKASLTAYVYAVKALKDLGVEIDGRLILEFVVDEEPGACSKLGTAYLLQRGIKAKAAIVAEPGSQVGIGHRGGYRFKLTTKGEAIHTGVSAWQKGERGKSAIAEMMRAIEALGGLDIPYKASKVFPGKKPMVTFPTMIEGGTAINMVPERCTAYGDVRLMPGNSDKQVRMLIEERLVKVEGLNFELTDLLFAPAVEVDKEEEIVQVAVEQYKKVTKTEPVVEGIGPWNDAWMLCQHDIPTITQMVLKGGGAHGRDEWVDLTSLKKLTEVLAQVVVEFLGVKSMKKKVS